MGDCNLTLNYNCQKNCKYSYSPWCPTCEINSPRRRTRSETSQVECRKKGRDMKSLTPKKYSRCQEYENMELEYNVKDGWCQTKESWFETKECCRVRTNLCELPTSYISNNCQTVDTSDYVVKSKQIFSDSNHLGSMPKLITENKKLDVIRPHYRTEPKVILKNSSPNTKSSSRDNQLCDDYRNCRDYCTLLDLKMHNIQDRSLCYDTTTYFNRREKDSLNLQEKYNNEVEFLRERLLSLKNSSYSIEQPNHGKVFINMMKEKYGEEPVIISKPLQIVAKKSQRKIVSPPNDRVRSKVTLKTRNSVGRIAAAKVKKIRPKTPSPVIERDLIKKCILDPKDELNKENTSKTTLRSDVLKKALVKLTESRLQNKNENNFKAHKSGGSSVCDNEAEHNLK
ncbi:unnamed protein product [Brassicogethes aeneus]|uniref:Uncharacterized protein n=1 Tax=Brassicogethes aeneus TaxID=1431903 RepID=A0A9P0FNE8_BRAAE|nr:unnamed protein product [Brassicogethes aeneus]